MAGNICFDIQEALNGVQQQAGAEIAKRDEAIKGLGERLKASAEREKVATARVEELTARVDSLVLEKEALENAAIAAKQSSGGTMLKAGERGPKSVPVGIGGHGTVTAAS